MPGNAKSALVSSEIFWLRINIADGVYVETRSCQPECCFGKTLPRRFADCAVTPRGVDFRNFDQPFAGVSQTALSSSAEIVNYMITPRKTNPRAEYRLREMQRVNSSASLAEKFPKLKSLKVDLSYFEPDGLKKTGEVRYKVNVEHAKSVFSFVCQSGECLAGDFDLSDAVAEAIAKRRKAVEGEIRCPGTRVKPKEDKRPCHNLLRYKLTLGYA